MRCGPAALVAPILFLVLASAQLPGLDLAEIKARGSLRVLVSADEEPEIFSFTAGPAPGFEREIIEGFAKLHRLNLQVVRVPSFADIIPALLKGDGDIIMAIIDTESRRKLVDFTVENLPSRHVVITRRPHRVVGTLGEFRREQVGVVTDTAWAEAAVAAGIPAAKTKGFADVEGVLGGLRSGTVSATVMSISNATLAARRDPALQLGLLLPGPSGGVAWAVRKADQELLRALNDYLGSHRKTASWSRLVVKYFGEDALNVLGRAQEE